MEANPSSSSSSPPVKKYDVFLSFRGEDTRNNFTSHLSLALRKIGLFNIFKDDIALDKGKDIGPELIKAIEDSHYAVVILSENYATSSWCLKELAKIVECMGDSGRIRTIFYHVNPSHVRNVISSDAKKQQESNFWKALGEHAKNPGNSEYLESWRNALVKVANQSGHPVDAHTDEAIFIKSFVADISSKLGASIRTIDGLFGMTSRLLDLDSYVLQSPGTNNICFIGIHGMGGIGKSTLARAYYEKMSHKFDGSIFLQNVREVCEKKANGLVGLQNKLLKGILEEDFQKVVHVEGGINMIRSRLCRKKVFIVLDDVSKLDQLNGLAGEDNWFGSGSIILVTTRDGSFLNPRRYTLYGAKLLNPSESLQLFSSKAFGNIEPPEKYEELSKRVVEYTSYLPLALTVLDSVLGGKTTSEWESALRRLKKCPEKEIVEILKIGFDGVNKVDQYIFLDIACFFNGFDKDDVIQILDSCGFEPIYGISNLIEKSLLSINEDKYGRSTILMHDLLQEMGKEIVREKSDNELGRQSRIWDEDDLYHILENREEKNKVEAIVTHLVTRKKYRFEALSFMKKLRLLQISEPDDFDGLDDNDGSDGFDCDGPEFSYNLQYLGWDGFAFTKLTSNFRKLVQLKLRWSKLKQLCWKGIEPLYNLKVIDLSYSRQFTKFEDFTVVPNLEKLILNRCSKLSEIHPSIKHLKRLIRLDLTCCESLEKLPEEINGLASLRTLNLYDCWNLKKLPEKINGMASLQTLRLDHCTSLEKLPEEINCMASLQTLRLYDCESLKKLPEEINGLTSLQTLVLDHCISLEKLPEEINGLFSLQTLGLSGCKCLEKLPEEINGLASLQTLDLHDCNKLEKLPDNLEQLKSLRKLDIRFCYGIERLPPSIFLLENLESVSCDEELMGLYIRENIISHRTIDECFLLGLFCTRLTRLDLSDCNLSGPDAFPEYFGKLVSLEYLDLSKNSLSFRPPGINGLSNLRELRLEHCESLRCLEAELLPSSLEVVDVDYCTSLASFLDPLKPSHLRCSAVYCLDCTELVKNQDGKMTALASLTKFLEDPSERRNEDFKFVVPQSDYELPSWFINQSSTPSITIKSDPNLHNRKLLGFAVVFYSRANSSKEDYFYFRARFPSRKTWETIVELGAIGSRMSNHLFLRYSGSLNIRARIELSSWDTLEFSFLSEHGSACGPCGVRLVYEEDIQELKQITSNYINDQKDVQSSHSHT